MLSRLRRRAAALAGELAAERREREALRVIAQAISQTLDLNRVLHEAFSRTLAVAGLEAGLLSLVDPQTGGAKLIAWRGIPEPLLEELHARKSGEGLAARVLATGQPLVSADLRREPELYARQAIVAGFRSYLCVPLRDADRVLGLCSVLSPDVARFRERDVRFLCELGEQIGVAIAHAQLYQRERRRAEQLRVINEVSRRIASILDPEELLPFVTQQLCEQFGYDNANIFLLDEAQQAMVFRAGTGPFHGPVPLGVRLRVGEQGIVGWVGRTGEPLLVPDVSQEPRYMELHELSGIRSELAVPIRAGDTVIGVVDIESRRLAAFDEGDLFTVQILADQIAVALENARLNAEARELAVTEERNRLAGEIHDLLAQGLTGIALQLELADVALDGDPALARKSVQKALALARGNLDEARFSVLDLRKGLRRDQTLPEALVELAGRFERESGIRTRVLTRDGFAERMPARVERGLYRIAEETLGAVTRRLGARHVAIEVGCVPGGVELVIEDDGRGFDPTEERGGVPAGVSLVAIQERTKLLGGTVGVQTAVNEGTRITVRVPVHLNGRGVRQVEIGSKRSDQSLGR